MTDPFVATLASGMQMFNLNPFSPALLRGWTRSVDGRMKKKRVGSKFAAYMWTYTREVLTRGQRPTRST